MQKMRSKLQGLLTACFLLHAVTVATQPLTLSFNEVMAIVRQYHPVARQANLSVDSAKAALLAARGAFDPFASVYNAQKTFDGKDYYFYTNPEIKIPTWYGIEVKAGLEDNGGSRLDPEATAGRSSYVGISLPLLQNLLLDKRRSTLAQAKLLVQQTEADRRNAYNDLLYQAAQAYWNWVQEYQVYTIVQNVVAVNRRRLDLVRRAWLGGDRAAIDTTEALTQLQAFMLMETEAYVQFRNTGLDLSNFLWKDDQPYDLPAMVVPDSTWVTDFDKQTLPPLEVMLAAAANHPKLQALGLKADILQIDRRLKKQSLLPRLDVNYNFLQKGYEPWKGIGSAMFENNYKYGFQVGMPLFLRQARGELRMTRIKLSQNAWQQSLALLEIQNKIKSYYNEAAALRSQVQLLTDTYQNYMVLLRAEELKFSIGESSLFLINSREIKTIEALQKLTELQTKYYKAVAGLQWAAGVL